MTQSAAIPARSALRDPLPLLQRLLRCPSVTPEDGGAMAVLAQALEGLGFEVKRLDFGSEGAKTPNLWAVAGPIEDAAGKPAPFLCLGGHTDVVPPGPDWAQPPFAGVVADGSVWGRGAADMKGALAAFVAAVARRLEKGPLKGRLAFLITGDEEGPGRHGTRAVIEWLRAQGVRRPDFCLLGEPSNPTHMGEIIKVGRRGSLNARVVVKGVQGHVAYPHRADNPLPRLVRLLDALSSTVLDEGTERFAPSSLQVTSIDVGNQATNVIPGSAEARLNIRFNDAHSGASLTAWLEAMVDRHAPGAALHVDVSGESFLTPCGHDVALLAQCVEDVTGHAPALDTGGGTSDARFITHWCPVAEFGLVGATMHKRDEHVSLPSLEALTAITERFMVRMGV
ncbi:succinyl-diaminopimelate desuccinylase [Formicincola oecophyllae]|uniref:Succinyl-diaminopimelate desuccinylase n=1 Tax=Formicincola oecophyllae TaxID=2558361 RepID=A0A4Y6UBQ5_9PROT|nr:succinyl-diaminopimelate desuccinylase [Formicincola oecophyllae]QDH13897.1 succinyl-diaminopimelate desuccinylase [Formicincola oecophyllae]